MYVAEHSATFELLLVWLVGRGLICASCAWLLIRRSRLALWPAVILAVLPISSLTSQWLQGISATPTQEAPRWVGLGISSLVVAAIIALRTRRVLR